MHRLAKGGHGAGIPGGSGAVPHGRGHRRGRREDGVQRRQSRREGARRGMSQLRSQLQVRSDFDS